MHLDQYRLRRLLWGLVAVALAAVAGAALWSRGGTSTRHGSREERPLEGLKLFGTLPDFSLIERSGWRVGLGDLRGKVWVANFIYTHCPDTCPLQSAQIARLQADFEGERDVRFVSISVDPEQDTPEVLAEYAKRYGADRDRWLFLTGEKQAIYRLAREGFRLSAVDPQEATPPPADRQKRSKRAGPDVLLALLGPAPALAHPGHAGRPFLHSSRFVLVDRQARIRGYYQSDDMEALKRLRKDLRTLLREG